MLLSFVNPVEYEYIVPMDDDYTGIFINKTAIKSIEIRSKCSVEFSKRILNKRIGTTSWTKFNIIRIKGPNEGSVKICNKLLECLNPNYIYRKEYDSQILPTIYTKEFIPDNTNLIYGSHRLGANLDDYQGLHLYNRYQTKTRYPLVTGKDNTPWKIYPSHIDGIHYPNQSKIQNIVAFIQQNIVAKPISHKIDRTLPNLHEVIIKRITLSKIAKADCAKQCDITDYNTSVRVSNKDNNEKYIQIPLTNNDIYELNKPDIRLNIKDNNESADEVINDKKESGILCAPLRNVLNGTNSMNDDVESVTQKVSLSSNENNDDSSSLEPTFT